MASEKYGIICIFGSLIIYTLAQQPKVFTIEDYIEEIQMRSSCNNTCESASTANCGCDIQCSEYDDCCFDSLYHDQGKRREFSEVCRTVQANLSAIYLVDACRNEWKGAQTIADRCQAENHPFTGTLFSKLPVTNLTTNVTYKNYYCALCNEDPITTPWHIFLEEFDDILAYNLTNKNITVEYILLNAVFSKTEYRYGLLLWSNDSFYFYSFSYYFDVPSAVRSHLRHCYSPINNCASNWTDSRISCLCGMHSDPIYINNVGYKNVYCALCNYMDPNLEMKCALEGFGSGGDEGPNLATLLDFNIGSGQLVGLDEVCKSGEIYDPLSKKCRAQGELPT